MSIQWTLNAEHKCSHIYYNNRGKPSLYFYLLDLSITYTVIHSNQTMPIIMYGSAWIILYTEHNFLFMNRPFTESHLWSMNIDDCFSWHMFMNIWKCVQHCICVCFFVRDNFFLIFKLNVSFSLMSPINSSAHSGDDLNYKHVYSRNPHLERNSLAIQTEKWWAYTPLLICFD